MRNIQNEIWLEIGDLVDSGVKEATIWNGVLRNSPKWRATIDPTDGRKRLIRYSSLADQYKVAVKAQLCGGLEPSEWLIMLREQAKQDDQLGRRAELIDKIQNVCENDYTLYLHHFRGVTSRQHRCLARAAGIIDVTKNWYQLNNISWKSYEPVKQVAEWVEQHLDEFFPLKYLPTNSTRLKEKVISFAVDKLPLNEVISLPRSGNENRATLKKEMWWQQIAVSLKQTGRYQNDRAIYRKVKLFSMMENKECPSETTVSNLLRETRILTADKQYDLNNKGRQRHRSSMPIAKPMFADDCWEMDGTRVQLSAHRVGDKELKSLYIVGVRDVYSGAYLGYWYGYSESEHAYRSALKMAVDITGRLPYELRYDRFPGSTSAGWKFLAGEKDKNGHTIVEGELERHGVKMTCTSASTGKASAERAFYTLQQVFESEHEAYIGQGIRSSTANARPTELYISRTWKSLLANGWNFDQAWMASAERIAAFNHTEYSFYSKKYAKLDLTPWQMYEQGESSGRGIDLLEISELFWNAKNVGILNNRIQFKDRDLTYKYDIQAQDFEVIYKYQKPNVKVVVRHDPFDFSKIMVFNNKGEFLVEIQEQKDIQLYGRTPDYKAATEWKENTKAIEKRKAESLAKYDLPDEMAVLLPTVASKQVYNDAQREYAYSNAGSWQAKPEKPKKKPVLSDLDDFDADAFARSQY